LIKAFPQSVSNVRAFEEDGTVLIVYDLFTTKSEKEFYINLYASKDGGNIFNPIYNSKGDANRNVKSGADRTITWKPENIQAKGLIFKVEAEPKKIEVESSTEKLTSGQAGEIPLMKIERKNNSVELTFSLLNKRQNGDTFIATNFFIVDNADKIYKKGIISTNGHEGNVIIVGKGSTIQFKLTINDVPETVTGFQKIEFNVSEIQVKFTGVKIGL
jgi:hypothetical protein